MNKCELDRLVHDVKLVVVGKTDEQLVSAVEQSEKLRTQDYLYWLDEYQYVEGLILHELSIRHPRRWAVYTEQDGCAISLRAAMLGD